MGNEQKAKLILQAAAVIGSVVTSLSAIIVAQIDRAQLQNVITEQVTKNIMNAGQNIAGHL